MMEKVGMTKMNHFVAFVLACVVVGCNADPPLMRGEVFRKSLQERYVTYEPTTSIDHDGDLVTRVSRVVHPERCTIWIREQERTRKIDVTRDLFDALKIGDMFDLSPPAELPVTEEGGE